PYLQNVTDTEATVIWATDRDAVSWVEVAPDDNSHFYATDRPKFFDTKLGKKNIGKLHHITIKGLNPATTYRYRIYSEEVTRNTNADTRYGAIIASDVFRGKPFRFRTSDPDKKSVHFAVVNDIHQNADRYATLFHNVDSAAIDFMILNGDMVNSMDSVSQSFNGFLNASSRLFATSMPFYMARGNHETRGTQSQRFMELFPSSTGMPYFAMRKGDVCFIVLDPGEDKPDNDIEYNGLSVFDQYRTDQAQWLEETVNSDMFKSAPVRIAVIHIPPTDSRPWHGSIELREKFLPILNRAGIDLMLCGHLHTYQYIKKGTDGIEFPIIINSNRDILDIQVDNSAIDLKVIDEKGLTKEKFRFVADR
ncbi:MAG: metallophosphoesterase, partial [Muribaculaceae bacterium]|nr:metallophosphoesterase [Muribaculaceae bacterium]